MTTTADRQGEGDTSAATLGGWNVAVSKYSTKQEAAISAWRCILAGPEAQKQRAIATNRTWPTIIALYDDADIAAAQPIIPQWKDVFLNAVPRPVGPRPWANTTKFRPSSGRLSTNTLSGNGTAAENLELLEVELTDIKGSGW